MKKIISAMLVAIFALSLAMPAFAFYYPGNPPSDDGKYNNYGPMTQNLIMVPYSSQEGEYLAFKACDIDFMDWSLLSSQVDELNTEDPNMLTYARSFFVDRGMREFDINNLRYPTDDVQFRKALSQCFDKPTFVATQLAGYAGVMDSPLTNHGAWYNPYCTGLYPYNLVAAGATLDAAGYVDQDADGIREGPGNVEFTLDVYIRSDDPDRDAMGAIFCANLVSIGLSVNEQHQPRSVCRAHCMNPPWDYNVYTGGWSFGRDPDVLYSLFHSQYAQAFGGTPNYPGYTNPAFDVAADNMLTAAISGVPYVGAPAPGTAAAYTWEMQQYLMDDAGVIPVFTYASYGAYKVGWNKVVNAVGTGPWSYYTFLNTWKAGADTVTWGQMNDITDWNPYHSQWVWDWNLLGEIFDSCINVNPYNMAEDLTWLAKSWVIGEWTYNAQQCTTITFNFREDVYWHDVPAKADRVTPGGAPLLPAGATNVPFTADDFVFSIYSVRDIPDSWNNALVANVLYAEKIDPYTAKVYLDLYMPLWALHWVGGLPIVPKHVWEPVFLEGNTRTFDAIAQKCLVGTGPWVYDYDASVLHSQYVLRTYPRFFRYHPLDVWAEIDKSSKVMGPTTVVTVSIYAHWFDSQRTLLPSEILFTLWAHAPYDVDITVHIPGGPTVITITGCTWTPVATFSVPGLPYCEDVLIAQISFHVSRGLATIRADITPDPISGHADLDQYPEYIWGTIPEDINLDFFVNAKDAVLLGKAFGTSPGTLAWNPQCDINKDGFVNAKDAVKLGTKFGWAGP